MMKFLSWLKVIIGNFVSFNETVTKIFQFLKYDMIVLIQFLFCTLLQVFRKISFLKNVAKVIKNICDGK